MPRKSNREKELENKIEEWKEELKIWEKNESEAGIVERRNLLNLISMAEKEIEEIHSRKQENDQELVEEQTFEEIKDEYEDAIKNIEAESKERNIQMNVLKLRIDRLKEEQKIYVGNKELFKEYEGNIEKAEEELRKLASADNAITKRDLKSKIMEAKDSSIKKVTLLKIKKDKEINEKKNEISEKQQEVQDVLAEADVASRMTEISLSDGTTIETPKVLEIYKEIDKLQEELRALQKESDEYQDYINALKGIEEKIETRTLEPEEVKYYHGQGDMQERGENGSRENFEANDEFFGFRKQEEKSDKDNGVKSPTNNEKEKNNKSSNDKDSINIPQQKEEDKINHPSDGQDTSNNPQKDKDKINDPSDSKATPNNPQRGEGKTSKPGNDKERPNNSEKEEKTNPESRNVYSYTYGKALNEYKMMLEMYNQDLETLYNLQAQYENANIEYSEYEKHADYMVERYRFMLNEYKKVLGKYEYEKSKISNQSINNDAKSSNTMQWHPDLTQEQIEYIQSELEIYKPEGDEYIQALLQLGLDPNKQPKPSNTKEEQQNNNEGISQWHPDLTQEQIEYIQSELEIYKPEGDEYIQALLQLGLDPSKQPKPSNTKEEQQNNNEGISQWHPDLTQEQIEYIQSELEIYKPEGDEYIQALLQLGLDPNKQPRYEEKENNVRNIVLEAPEKPAQPMMILEKEKGDEDPRIPRGKKLSNLPVRSFWEIYNDTNTEHASNLAIKIHNFAHMNILPGKDEDSLTKALSVPLIPIKLVMKLGTIIPNKLMGTDKKLDKMAEKISQLSPAEFEVLVSSADKANEIFGANIKDSFDMDYLDPQFMKQYKVNELYLKAVSGRFNGEKLSEISEHRAEALKCENEIAKLDKIKRSRELTDEEQQLYNELTEEKQEHIEIGKNLRADIDTFSDGIKKRSSVFKNIRGWFLASFNPDNREENAKMAQISKERREAGEIGDSNQVNSKTNEMAEFANQQTKIKGLRNDKIDRGKFSIESPIEMLDRGEENRGRLLLTDVAIIASAIDLVNQIKNIKDVQASIDSHNMDIQNANQANSQIPVSGEVDISKINGAPETQEALARQTVESAFNRTERGDFSANNWDINSAGYKAADAINHAESAQVANAVKNAIANGKPNEALKLATQFFAKNAGRNEQEMQNLLNTGYSYDYSAINWGAAADAQTILNFFNGKAKFNEVVSGTMVTTLQNINDGVSPLSAILAGANAVYQATKVKNKFKHDLRKSANASQENNKEQQENENSDVEHQEDLEQNNNEYDERE